MAFLEKFSAEERDMLIALPYRAGLWIITADRTGGPSAEDAEIEALEKVITKMSRGMFGSAFAHEVMAETFARRSEWQNWKGGIDDVPAACETASKLVAGKLAPHELEGYRQNIMNIAGAVAGAFREFDHSASLPEKTVTYLKLAVDRVIGAFRGEQYNSSEILNVSYDEDLALAKLAKALGIDTASVEDAGGKI